MVAARVTRAHSALKHEAFFLTVPTPLRTLAAFFALRSARGAANSSHETYISAQQSAPQAHARFSHAHGHEEWPQSACPSPCQGPQASYSLGRRLRRSDRVVHFQCPPAPPRQGGVRSCLQERAALRTITVSSCRRGELARASAPWTLDRVAQRGQLRRAQPHSPPGARDVSPAATRAAADRSHHLGPSVGPRRECGRIAR